MSDEMIMQIVETIGKKADTVLYVYWVCEYTILWVVIILVAWGIRTMWKTWKEHGFTS